MLHCGFIGGVLTHIHDKITACQYPYKTWWHSFHRLNIDRNMTLKGDGLTMSNPTCKIPDLQASRKGDKAPKRAIHPRRIWQTLSTTFVATLGRYPHISPRHSFILVCAYITQRGLVRRCTLRGLHNHWKNSGTHRHRCIWVLSSTPNYAPAVLRLGPPTCITFWSAAG